MQRAKTQFRFGDDDVALLELVVEQVVQFPDVDDADGLGQLAVDDDVNAVSRRIDAVRRIGDGNVASIFRSMPTIDNLDAVDRLEVAPVTACSMRLMLKTTAQACSWSVISSTVTPLFALQQGREGVLALVVGVGIIEIPVDQHLPCNLHLVAVDRGVDGPVVLGIEQIAPSVIAEGNDMFAVGEHVCGARISLHYRTVNIRAVWGLDDPVGLEVVEPDTRARQLALSFTNRYWPSWAPSVKETCGWRRSSL
jgi:hypothetical protein